MLHQSNTENRILAALKIMYLHEITFNSWYVFNVTFKMNCRLVRLFSMSGTIEHSLAGNKLNTQLSVNIHLKLKKKPNNIITKTQIAYLWEFFRNLKIRRIFFLYFDLFSMLSNLVHRHSTSSHDVIFVCKSTLPSNRVKKNVCDLFFICLFFLVVCRI